MPLPITSSKTPRPPRVFLYGPPGIGKTTLAASFPGVLVLPAEEGADALDVPRLPRPRTWEEAISLLDAVAADPSGYRALAIDSVTALEQLCQAYVAQQAQVATVEEIPYGRGFPIVSKLWTEMLDRLENIRAKGLAIILVGHLSVISYADPRTQPYDRFSPRLHKSILPQTIERCDAVLLANYKVFTSAEKGKFNVERVRAVGGGDRVLHCVEEPTHLAKNRYGLPSELPMDWAPVIAGIMAAFKTNNPPAQAATTSA